MKSHGRLTAIVPAAGSGSRLGAGTSKPFVTLLERPLILWTLRALESADVIDEIIPVFSGADMERGLALIEQYGLRKIKRIASGGPERRDSVYNALRLVRDADTVLVHDGARPLIEPELIKKAVAALGGFDGSVLAVPAKDTMKEAGDNDTVLRTLDREAIWAVQTPQVFPLKTLSDAYEEAMRQGLHATDDASLVERRGGRVKIVMGSYMNIKVTTPEDVAFAEMHLRRLQG